MKHQKGIDYSKIIIWAAALVGMVRYSAAFLSSDLGTITGGLSEFITFCLGVSGFAMGILGTLGLTYIFDGWRQKMPSTGNKWSNKFIALTAFIMAAFVAEIIILVPFTMSRVLHVSVADVLHGGVWWWSTAVVIMPLLLIGGVSVGNQIVTVDIPKNDRTNDRTLSESADTKADNDRPMSAQKRTKSELTPADWKIIAVSSSNDIVNAYGCDERTARRWRKDAQETTSPPFP